LKVTRIAKILKESREFYLLSKGQSHGESLGRSIQGNYYTLRNTSRGCTNWNNFSPNQRNSKKL